MSRPPSSAVTIDKGEVAIDAELLAPKLGLSTETLKAEMRRGYVYSLAEIGIDEDEGRRRLTFRYRARSWTVVVEPDGTLFEAPRPANRDKLSVMDLVERAS